jgi:uncharacterized membrane protein (Fun14 family)
MPAQTQGVLAQLGVGGLLVVVVAYVMVHVFKLFIDYWNKQETERTEAYKASAEAHAKALTRMSDTLERMNENLGDKVIAAFASTTSAVTAPRRKRAPSTITSGVVIVVRAV